MFIAMYSIPLVIIFHPNTQIL